MQVNIKQKVHLQTTLAGLAELCGLHTVFEAGDGQVQLTSSCGRLFQIQIPSGKKDCLYTLFLVNGTRYFIECPLKATVGVRYVGHQLGCLLCETSLPWPVHDALVG